MRFKHLVKPLSGLFRSEAPPALPPPAIAVPTAAAAADVRGLEEASIEEPQELARLVVEGSSSHARQLAAQRIEDPAELKRLLKLVRGKDKNVYKIIKQKCDLLGAAEKRIAQIETDVAAACASLERHSHRIYDAIYEPSFRHFDERWRALEDQAPHEVRDRAHRAIERCREIIAGHFRLMEDQAKKKTHQASLLAAREEATLKAAEEARRRSDAEAVAAEEAAKLREAGEKARAEKLAAEALALGRIGALIGKAHGALREGDTGRAPGLRRAIQEKLAMLPAVPPHVASQVRELDVKLNELKEWKDYAVAPKRARLIEEMESLIGSPQEPQALADRIKHLQEEWKTISKGIVIDSEADWQRFHQASQTAYQPCRAHFEAQSRLRQENLEKREAVIERLRAFESSQNSELPDWRAIATVLREAPREWRRYSPVDRAAGRRVLAEFDASMGRLQTRLDSWHAQNAEQKKSLIQRAQHLRAQADGRDAVDAVKRLQQLWKETGAAARDQERQLWEEFREQCNAVYQKRQQAHAEYTSGLESSKQQAVALCEEVERFAALTGPALLEGPGRIAPWRAAFESLGEMPHADQRGLHARFERALDLVQSSVSRQKAHDRERSVADLLEAGRLIQAFGRAVARDGAAVAREELKLAAEAFIAGVPRWPKGAPQALKDAWLAAGAAAEAKGAAHEKALRMLCIRSEILTDEPTPPEDQALRREYQVQRLVQHMGRPGDARADDLDALALEWVRVGPAPPQAHESLLGRFLRCRIKRPPQPLPRADRPREFH